MPSTRPWTRSAVVAVLLLAAGCSTANEDATDSADAPDADDAAWTTSTDPVDAGGLVWASDDVVHLSDGTTVDVGEAMTTYVVAGDGVYFTPANDEGSTDHRPMSTGDLLFADRDGVVTGTGLTVYVESIGSSPDGRYLGMVDATSGKKDNFSDYPQATALIVDLSTGERVVDTTDGMGDPDEDDLAHDYPEVYLRVRFPDDVTAFVEGLGDQVFSLPDGEGEPTEEGMRSPTDPVSPDGSWSIEDRGYDDRIRTGDVAGAGAPVDVTTGTPRRDLRWWLDSSTVVGIAIDGPGTDLELGPRNTSTLITCQIPDGTCAPVAGTQGEHIRFPLGAGDEGLDLGAQGGES